MTPTQFLYALRSRFGVFAFAVGLTVLATIAVSLLLPATYRATAALVVDTRQEQSLSNVFDAIFSSPSERTSYLQTQIDILTSPIVARKMVEDLQLADRRTFQNAYENGNDDNSVSIEEWLTDHLPLDLDVETSLSSVLRVSYESGSAADAALIANGFADAYMDTVLELKVEPTRQAAAWFDEQLKTLRDDLEAAQTRMTRFQKEHGIVSADETLDEEHSRFTELSAQLLEAQQESRELQASAMLARDTIEHAGPLNQLPDIQSDENIQQLHADIIEGEARLKRLATQYGTNHPEYRRQLAENESRRADVAAEIAAVVASLDARRRQSERRTANTEAALDAQRARLLDLKENRDELTVLMRNVATAQNAYDTAMQRFVVSQVDSRASSTNIALLSPAVAPNTPHRPKPLLNLALAIAVGVVLGTGLVTLLELTDRRIRTHADLVTGVGVPLLGELSLWKPSDRLLLTGPTGISRAVDDDK